MSYTFLLALGATAAEVLPLVIQKRFRVATIVAIVAFLAQWALFYSDPPSLVYPLLGLPGVCIAGVWVVIGLVQLVETQEFSKVFILPIIYIVLLVITGISSSGAFRASQYAGMIGPVEERDWTKDVQPKDPRHMRMVSDENAMYIAQKVVAGMGSIGSQFQLDKKHMTLQKVKDQLVYVIPFDFASFSTWVNSAGSPGFIIVDAEDPERAPQLVELPKDKLMQYTTDAWFGKNLIRHIRENGFIKDGLTEPRFELDDEGHPWWVVSTYELSTGWSGEKITGVVTVDPASGDIHRYGLDSVPVWIDRVIPEEFVAQYIDWHGSYSGGWLNSWWGEANLTESEGPILIYGADDRAEWVTGVTSTNEKDDSLIGLMYTDSRTGKTVYYKTNGGATDPAIIKAVNANQQVQFKHLHATTPQIYNLYGTMAAVTPLANENHAYQGMAIVSVNNPQNVGVGSTQSEALRSYQAIMSNQGQQIAIGKESVVRTLTGVVDRINQDVESSGTIYLFHVAGAPRIFTASSSEYVKLSLTQSGDTVALSYVASGEDVVPVKTFDNISLPLDKTKQEDEVQQSAAEKQKTEETRSSADELVKKIKTMSPEQLEQLEKALNDS